MYHYKQHMRVDYQMAAPSSTQPSSKSRGHSLFDRQAQLHAHDPNNPSSTTIADIPLPIPALRAAQSLLSAPASSSVVHRRMPLSSAESYAHSTDTSVRLLSIHPRPEATNVKATPPALHPPPPSSSSSSRVSSQLQVTDFPLDEYPPIEESEEKTHDGPPPDDSSHDVIIRKALHYPSSHDDDDDVVHKEHGTDEPDSYSHAFNDSDDEDQSNSTNDLDATPDIQALQTDSGLHTLSSTGINETNISEEKFDEQQQQLPMPSASQGLNTEGDDSDFSEEEAEVSPEEEEQATQQDSSRELEEERRNQIILHQQQTLRSIVQEWQRKELSYCEQLRKMDEQLSLVLGSNGLQKLIQQLIEQHNLVYQKIEDLSVREQQSASVTDQLTDAVELLMDTLPVYGDYIQNFLPATRKLLDKRATLSTLPSEDLLSIPPKQFLQISSQVQDLYQTSQSFETDEASVTRLYGLAQRCRLYGSRQVENINTVILKNEDVVTMSARGNRERCRLILYPDTIVSCNLRARLLANPRFTLLWFIPMTDLEWTVQETSLDENTETGDELKTSLKSVYKALEQAPKTNPGVSTRLSKNIRKQENEFQLAQSKLRLVLSNTRAPTSTSVILFSSAYQRQDWIDLIDKAKQDLLQRNSAVLQQTQPTSRLTESVIQKRLDLIKPHLYENHPNESPSSIQNNEPSRTYSGTLCITIHNIQGSALYNVGRQYQTLPSTSSAQQQMQRNYQFCVAVEIDSYHTFYPHAQTARQTMHQNESVEFKGEVFHIELEHSLAFRLLVYRIETAARGNTSSLQRPVCIGKFHHDIETALHDCKSSPNKVTCLASESGDLRLQISLQYSKREGTFKRQTSKRSLAVFGKSIEKLASAPDGLIDGIPRLVVKCVELVEREGLNETGIYRVCCVASDLQKLRHEFDRNCRRAEGMLEQKNVHVAANLLKLFFRELPDPLFSSTLYKQFLHAVQLTDTDNQRVMLLKAVELLPSANQKILFYLLDHLIRVSQCSQTNMMHLDNLAVVFGPTLMRPSKLILTTIYGGGQATATDLDQMSSELQGSMHQCQVVLACMKLRQDQLLK